MITPNALTRSGLISTSPTGQLTSFLANRDFVPRNMNLFQQRFDQTAPQDITEQGVTQNNAFGLAQLKDSSKNFIKTKLLEKFSNFKPPTMMMLGSMLPQEDPVISQSRDYFTGLYGLDDIGRVQQGELMAGYNPISGGGLYTLTGGKFGEPPNVGLDKAYQKRIDTIKNVGIPRLLRAGKDTTNLKKRLDALIAQQAADNQAVQQIKLANATAQQKQTIKDMKSGKINTNMPEQPSAPGGGPQPIQTSGGNIGDRVSKSYRDDPDTGLV